MDAEHALGVLRGQRGHRVMAKPPSAVTALMSALDAGAAAGIRAGDDQDAAEHLHRGRPLVPWAASGGARDRAGDLSTMPPTMASSSPSAMTRITRLGARLADHQPAAACRAGASASAIGALRLVLERRPAVAPKRTLLEHLAAGGVKTRATALAVLPLWITTARNCSAAISRRRWSLSRSG